MQIDILKTMVICKMNNYIFLEGTYCNIVRNNDDKETYSIKSIQEFKEKETNILLCRAGLHYQKIDA